MLPVTIDYYVDFDTDSFSNIVPVIQEEDTDEEELLLGRKMLRGELCKEIAMFTGKLESPGKYSNLHPGVDAKRQAK
jgi:hypothetical protein